MNPTESDIVIACCRDEADIITEFVDFYLDQGFDYVCLIDNGSRDGTVNRLLSHPAQSRIQLRTDSRVGYDQRLLEYYHSFAALATRWVFFVDVDEFIAVPGGIKKLAAQLPPSATILELPTTEMVPAHFGAEFCPLEAERREARFHSEQKVVWQRSANVTKIFCGKHNIEAAHDVRHREPDLFIRHFHTRSAMQFRHKMQNRIETHESIAPEVVKSLGLFTEAEAEAWMEDSKRSLQASGWEREKARLAGLKTLEDTVVRDWYRHRQSQRKFPDFSPVIDLLRPPDSWLCFCVKDFELREGHTASDHLVLVLCPPEFDTTSMIGLFEGCEEVPVRVHSECLFGDVFGSRRCDCGEQLADALEEIERIGMGVFIYLRQEGRGLGLFDKIRSLDVDHEDTFARNEQLGFPGDARDYHLAGRVLKTLGVSSVRLLSGNPQKARRIIEQCIRTVLEPRVRLEAVSSDARHELRAKIGRGYRYEPETVA